jgi:hypothetical protein
MFSFTWLTLASLRHLSIVLMRHFILMPPHGLAKNVIRLNGSMLLSP